MRILHTADWHVGKVLKGHPRLEEHDTVLRDIVRVAREEDVDLVVVAGDVFDTSTPTPDAQNLVIRTLLGLRNDGRHVIVEAGNHDNPRQLDVFRPLLGELGITVVGQPRRPSDGGQVEVTTRSGERARVAVLPFISQRHAISASQAMTQTEADRNREYADNLKAMVDALTEGFEASGAVNLLMTHATLVGGTRGGGERESQTVFEYALPATLFPSHLHYAALGHLHRRQTIPGPAPLHYSGSPLQVDFGEGENTSVVVIVDVTADTPARTKDVEISGGRRLRTVTGTLADLEKIGVAPEDWLRVVVREKPRAGLADDVRDLLPGTLEVRIDPEFSRPTATPTATRTAGRSPVELFGDYLASQNRGDAETLTKRFAELLDDVQGVRA
jgi:DNA repair protein SbcD/Mre11